jgi:hypothetical protein
MLTVYNTLYQMKQGSMTTTRNVPLFSASTIEAVCKVLGEAVAGPQVPDLIAS